MSDEMDGEGEARNVVHGDNSGFAFQAGDINNSSLIFGALADKPEEIYARAVKYLDRRRLSEACATFADAWVRGYHGHDIIFHWLLSLMSGKAFRQLTAEDYAQLQEQLVSAGRLRQQDEWSEGVAYIRQLLLPKPVGKPKPVKEVDKRQPALIELGDLNEEQSTKIFAHLGLLLHGRDKDELWQRSLRSAQDRQCADGRKQRAWKFFHPDPAGPRVREPERPRLAFRSWFVFIVLSMLAGWTTVQLARLIVDGRPGYSVLAPLLLLVGSCVGLVHSARWRARVEKIRYKDRVTAMVLDPPDTVSSGEPDGFTHQVDSMLKYYFGKHLPPDVSRAEWMARTHGVRQELRSELLHIYRESRVEATTIAWVIRYHARDAKKRWKTGSLLNHRQQLKTSAATVLSSIGGLVIIVLAGLSTIIEAAHTDLLAAMGLTVLAVATAGPASRMWFRFFTDWHRYELDKAEAAELYKARETEFLRWTDRLSDRPSDVEMATWLDCDRKVMLHKVMTSFKLTVEDLESSAFLESPDSRVSAQENCDSPRRYRRYLLYAFLITSDGVRQIRNSLDMQTGELTGQGRRDYQFDSIVEGEVTEKGGYPTKFELGLTSGGKIEFPLALAAAGGIPSPDPARRGEERPGTQVRSPEDAGQSRPGADTRTLGATGFSSALYLLEGIAAEGRQWLKLEEGRSQYRLRQLNAAPQQGDDDQRKSA